MARDERLFAAQIAALGGDHECAAFAFRDHDSLGAMAADLLGRAPRFFRAGTAWYDEVAVEIVRALGEIPIGFDVNADAGATYPAATVAAETARATAGSIIIGHLNAPKGATF